MGRFPINTYLIRVEQGEDEMKETEAGVPVSGMDPEFAGSPVTSNSR